MKLNQMIEYLKKIKKSTGDIRVKAFHAEGGNSQRGEMDEVEKSSFEVKNGCLEIGGK